MPNNTLPPEIWAVVPAGGSGSRYASNRDKLLVSLDGIPVLVRTIMALQAASAISGIVVVCSPANREQYQAVIAESTSVHAAAIRFAVGGPTRRESVYNGLLALPESAEIVVVHDAARPMITAALIESTILPVQEGAQGAIAAIPILDTVKEASPPTESNPDQPFIQDTLDRSRLWRAQTPQVFPKAHLMQAHRQIPMEIPTTDDAQLIELAGLGPVALVPGDERNLKITRPIDVLMAEAFLRADAVPLL